jgi:molecular chaperone DnaK (HSP70)
MLNLDEAINRFEKLASDCEFNLNMHKNHVMNLSVNDIERIQEHLEENRQLAEWLRELEKLRKIPDKLVPKYRDGIQDEYERGANEMLKEVIDDIRKYIEEVKVDGNSD